MADKDTLTVGRIELRRILVAFGVNEKNITALLASMEKSHRHINVITFASMLEKSGLARDKIKNVFRRIGMDDIAISQSMEMIDEQKSSAETGRVYNAAIDLS
ncbi:hypothetical protein B2A_11242 [mine drainage metagenome]|uniref:Uncharacterized protein n=1 Tax=mine drainage metagenome TaxID=410659 RepID=T1ADS4_9ZZZZ